MTVTVTHDPYFLGHPSPVAYTPYRSVGQVITRHPLTRSVGSSPSSPKAVPTHSYMPSIQWGHAVLAALSIGAGVLLKRAKLPARSVSHQTLLPTDWKVYAGVLSGLLGMQQFNKAIDNKPPAWLSGMEAVAFIHPITGGFSKANLIQGLILAPMVGVLAEGVSRLNQVIRQSVQLKGSSSEFSLPTWLIPVTIGVGATVLGAKLIPKLVKPIQHKLSQLLKLTPNSGATLGGGLITCARGCTPGGIICLSEFGEMAQAGGLIPSTNGHAAS